MSKWAYFCIQPRNNFIYLMYSAICLLYRVIQDFMQKALFLIYRQLEVDRVALYDKG